MVSASVWQPRMAAAYWLHAAPKAVRNSLFLTRITESKPSSVTNNEGKQKEVKLNLCFFLFFCYLWKLPKVLSLGKEKKNKFSFCFSLAYSYLCTVLSVCCASGQRLLWERGQARGNENQNLDAMKAAEFVKKIFSLRLWANLVAMALVVVLLCFGVKDGIDFYTHHGEKIIVPDVKHKSFSDAKHILADRDLEIVVSDTGYIKTLPPDCILEQSPEPGAVVKSGRLIYVIINSPSTPKLTIPDVIDNSSMREARAKLIAMGFKVIDPEYVPGERDWVYGIKVRGRNVVTGDRVSIEDPLILQVGDGKRDLMDSVSFIDPVYPELEEEDEFEEVLELETNHEGNEPKEVNPAQPSQPAQPAQPAEPKPSAPATPQPSQPVNSPQQE